MSATEAAQAPAFSLRSLLAIRSYRLVWSGQMVSDFSDSLTRMVLLLMINRITGSVASIASLTIVLMLPRLLFGFAAGVFVDRLNRKHLMVLSGILRGAFVLGFLLIDSPERLWLLYLIAFLQGSVATFFEPARMALLPNLVPAEGLLAANSVSMTSQSIFMILGSAAAGVLVGQLDSYAPIFLANSAAFLLSALLIGAIRYQHAPRAQTRDISGRLFLAELWEGIRISFGTRVLLGTIAAIGLTMLGVGATNVLMIPMLVNDLRIPETWLGATNAGEAIGILIGGGLIAALSARFRPTHLVTIGLVGLGAGLAAIAFAENIWHVIAIELLLGMFIPAVNSSTQTILQTAVPDTLRGRTGAARMVLVMLVNLVSMGLAGGLADRMGARNVFILGGACAVLGGIAALMIFRGVDIHPNRPIEPELTQEIQ